MLILSLREKNGDMLKMINTLQSEIIVSKNNVEIAFIIETVHRLKSDFLIFRFLCLIHI